MVMRLLKELNAIFLVVLVSLSYFSHSQSHTESIATQIHPLRTLSGSAADSTSGLYCLSWRLAVETDNLKNWYVPKNCTTYLAEYITGGQYEQDCLYVTEIAYDYAKSVALNKDGKDIWIFDVYETSLSNAPYYKRADVEFGAYPYNATKFNEWVAEGKAPALPSVLDLYKKVMALGLKVVFMSGTATAYREPMVTNMKNVGYTTWEMMIFKSENETKLTAQEFKTKSRTELVNKGYRIIGNIGDEWSDISGANRGLRTFKIPNPMYYVA